MSKKPDKTRPRRPRARRSTVTRSEFDRLAATFDGQSVVVTELRHDLDIQFKRTAQIQSELEELQRSLQRVNDLVLKR